MTTTRKKSATKSATKRNGSAKQATALLKEQHRKVEGLFKQIEGARSRKEDLVTELANDLAGHMKIEQEIFYPRVRQLDEDLVLESFEEHSIAEVALKRLLDTSPEEETFDARVTVLKELILHHVEEEEKSLFPKVDKKLDAAESEQLASEMKAMFDDAVAEGYESILPEGTETTSSDIAEQRVLEAPMAAHH
ncbi:MAG TPA: hemerythrin domain-containing protein [Polyangiaceae bacterium]|nr:hemerythrin domain-containing protein [Polyangiaceae bacterium]